MEAEKIRNMSDTELDHQQRELNDQLFRLKFQLKMGQTESLKKIRGLRKDVARIQTIMREKQLGLNNGGTTDAPATEKTTAGAAAAPKKTKAKAAARRRTAVKKKSAASKRTATKKRTKTPAAKATRKK